MKLLKFSWNFILIVYYKLAFNIAGIMEEEYYVQTARYWMQLGKYKKAIVNLEKAIKVYDVSYIRSNLAYCYIKIGKCEQACVHYEKAYEKKKDLTYIVYIAYCKYHTGNKDEAFKLINEVNSSSTDKNVLEEANRIGNHFLENPIDRLKKAIKDKNGDEIESVLPKIDKNEKCKAYVDVLIELLGCDWHSRHEDIALELQRIKDPRAIPILRQTAERKFEYLSYVDSQALARKCIWALADIGTDDSKTALTEISCLSDKVISGYAKERLDCWEQEKPRKSTTMR
jgi:tetratricopeptide (TPR) repeat protein